MDTFLGMRGARKPSSTDWAITWDSPNVAKSP
jgi:hypothetical protein